MSAVKSDINKSTWEDTDIPSVCERCLGPNPYTLMTRERHGEQCKICTRPFTVFRWRPEDAGGRYKKSTICNTCARQKNCCQSCMLDLSFGLPIAIRDAALKMVGAGGAAGSMALTTSEPQNIISKQFVAQNIEARLKEQGDEAELYAAQGQAEEAGKKLLQQLANAQPYNAYSNVEKYADQTSRRNNKHPLGVSKSKAADISKIVAKLPPGQPLTNPKDPKIMSLFLTGVEDSLPEYELRNYFTQFGPLKSLVCSHRSRCAFVNYNTREAAEKAAAATGSTLVLKGFPLRVTWGRPRPIGDEEHGLQNAKLAAANKRKMLAEARAAIAKEKEESGFNGERKRRAIEGKQTHDELDIALPPGQASVTYASQREDFEA
ncbi:putative Pre-mRNA-splicing factor slt11 [Myxozyma melibiosi]|uniref:Pre-mRNA-splicing factor SLT11 n=1 Tax=Myxozyma melibiosi TaxID=54550 RepID=A0ABR1FBP6_9ASCO